MGISRKEWIFSKYKDPITKDKRHLIDQYVLYMLSRTQKMFEYQGLPDTIPQKDLECILQTTGSVTITKVKNELYAFCGGLGGVPNTYYHPTESVISNPYLNYSATLKIDQDCVLILNDSQYQGLMPMFLKYAELLAESDISNRIALINSRMPKIISSDNDPSKKDADLFLEKIENGSIGVIGGNAFFKGIRTDDFNSVSSSSFKDLIEMRNYIESTWYSDLGLNSCYNMKRESLSENEINADNSTLIPLIDDMLKMRQDAIEKINAMYGTSISVDLSDVWKQAKEQITTDPQDQDQDQEVDQNEIERD